MSSTEIPPIEYFPKSHIVTFKYYVGVILFLDERYFEAGFSSAPIFNQS